MPKTPILNEQGDCNHTWGSRCRLNGSDGHRCYNGAKARECRLHACRCGETTPGR